jgi:hypothetical protein
MPSDLSTPPRPNNFSRPTRVSLALVGGCTMCRASITCFLRRASPALPPSTLVSLTDAAQRINSAIGDRAQGRFRPNTTGRTIWYPQCRREETPGGTGRGKGTPRSLQGTYLLSHIVRRPPFIVKIDRRGCAHINTNKHNRARNWRSTRCCERRATGC